METIRSVTSPDKAPSDTQTGIMQNSDCQKNLLKIKEFFQRIWFTIQNFFAEFLECSCVKYHLSLESIYKLDMICRVDPRPTLHNLIHKLGFSSEALFGEEEVVRLESREKLTLTPQDGFNMPFQIFQKFLNSIDNLHRLLLWMNTKGEKHIDSLYICSTTGQFFAKADVGTLPQRYTPVRITELCSEVAGFTDKVWGSLLSELWDVHPTHTTESHRATISTWIDTQRSALNAN